MRREVWLLDKLYELGIIPEMKKLDRVGPVNNRPSTELLHHFVTAVQPVFTPVDQFVPQLELYSQLQLILWSAPITVSVPKST